MALSDFWQVKDNQVVANKPILNVYHVKRILVGATAATVAQAFLDTILGTNLPALQVIGTTRTTVEVENLGDVTDFISVDSSAFPGTRAVDALASFNAATIQFNRTRTDMKNGQKRYFAGNENDKDGNNWDATFIALMEALAVTLIAPWEQASAPGIGVCELAILKRFCVVPLQDPCVAYRLPNSSTEIDANHYVPVATLFRARVRSQVSRKVLT